MARLFWRRDGVLSGHVRSADRQIKPPAASARAYAKGADLVSAVGGQKTQRLQIAGLTQIRSALVAISVTTPTGYPRPGKLTNH
jgi:hypothetical protein